MNKGLLIVLSGPSGAGKGTVLKEILRVDRNIKVSISATTRSPRDGEENGREYFFINKETFFKTVSDGGMLEYAEYCGNFYGTPKKNVELWLNEGYDVVLEIETQGGEQIKSLVSDAVGIFVVPPSFEELSNRLINRRTDSVVDIKNRLNTAQKEIKSASRYDYIVVNDEIEKCANCIRSIIEAEKLRTKRNPLFIEEVFINA